MGHTPGPWHINPLFDYSVNSENKHVAMINISVRGKECDIDHPEAQANANLIAAAPDLLAACEAFFRWSEAEDDEYVDELIQVTEMARIAIAKAKGEDKGDQCPIT